MQILWYSTSLKGLTLAHTNSGYTDIQHKHQDALGKEKCNSSPQLNLNCIDAITNDLFHNVSTLNAALRLFFSTEAAFTPVNEKSFSHNHKRSLARKTSNCIVFHIWVIDHISGEDIWNVSRLNRLALHCLPILISIHKLYNLKSVNFIDEFKWACGSCTMWAEGTHQHPLWSSPAGYCSTKMSKSLS